MPAPTGPAVARAVCATALTGMGVLHFTPSGRHRMASMIPPRLRGSGLLSPDALVLLSGACEVAGAGGLMIPATRRAAGAALIGYFAAVFPANAYAAQDPDRFGAVAVPLLPRLGAQVLFGALAAYAAFGRR